jgi:hypothetical protein
MSAPPIHARTDGASCFSVGILHLRARQFITMPASDKSYDLPAAGTTLA